MATNEESEEAQEERLRRRRQQDRLRRQSETDEQRYNFIIAKGSIELIFIKYTLIAAFHLNAHVSTVATALLLCFVSQNMTVPSVRFRNPFLIILLALNI